MEAVEETLTELVAEIKTLRKQVKTLSTAEGKGEGGRRAPSAFNLYMKKATKKLQKKHASWDWGRCFSTAAGDKEAYIAYKVKNNIVIKTKAPKKAVVYSDSDSGSDSEVPKKKALKKGKKAAVSDSEEAPKKAPKAPKAEKKAEKESEDEASSADE